MLLRVLAILTMMSVLICGIGAFIVLPEFEELFINLGAELPFSTQLVLETYPYWLVVLIIPIGIYLKYLTQQELSKKVKNIVLLIFVSMLLFSVALIPLVITAMYLPIFELEAASVVK